MPKAVSKPEDAKIVSVEPLDGNEARWTKLVRINYHDPTGQQRTWESAERTTRPPNSKIDGVGIIAILRKSSGPEILLQKQFRPPTGKVCIEVPAGLIDEDETPEECAVRELKEETGYVGVAEKAERMGGMGVMFNGTQPHSSRAGWELTARSVEDPGFTNTNLCMVHVSIDVSLPENQPENLKPELEENEFIEVFSVPLKSLWTECQRLEGEGYAIDARVGTLAEGIEVAKKWELFGRT